MPSVLLAGMKVSDNQFSRGLRQLGCRVEHVHNVSSSQVPTWPDFAVVSVTQASHGTVGSVKDAYKRVQKPCIIASLSFAEIKPSVEEEILQIRARERLTAIEKKEREEKTMRKALLAAESATKSFIPTAIVRPKEPEPTPQEEKRMPQNDGRARSESGNLISASEIARTVLAQGRGTPQAFLEEAARVGFVTRAGAPATELDAKRALWNQSAPSLLARKKQGAARRVTPEVPRADALLDQVLSAEGLSDSERIRALKAIRSGELKTLWKHLAVQQPDGSLLVRRENMLFGTTIEFTFTREGAELIVSQVEAFKRYLAMKPVG